MTARTGQETLHWSEVWLCYFYQAFQTLGDSPQTLHKQNLFLVYWQGYIFEKSLKRLKNLLRYKNIVKHLYFIQILNYEVLLSIFKSCMGFLWSKQIMPCSILNLYKNDTWVHFPCRWLQWEYTWAKPHWCYNEGQWNGWIQKTLKGVGEGVSTTPVMTDQLIKDCKKRSPWPLPCVAVVIFNTISFIFIVIITTIIIIMQNHFLLS